MGSIRRAFGAPVRLHELAGSAARHRDAEYGADGPRVRGVGAGHPLREATWARPTVGAAIRRAPPRAGDDAVATGVRDAAHGVAARCGRSPRAANEPPGRAPRSRASKSA